MTKKGLKPNEFYSKGCDDCYVITAITVMSKYGDPVVQSHRSGRYAHIWSCTFDYKTTAHNNPIYGDSSNAFMPKYGVCCLTSVCHHVIRRKHISYLHIWAQMGHAQIWACWWHQQSPYWPMDTKGTRTDRYRDPVVQSHIWLRLPHITIPYMEIQ